MNTLKLSKVALTGLSLALATSANAVVISYWDFNNGFDEADESLQLIHTATQGNGTVYQQRADTDGNGKGGVAYNDEGLTLAEGRAMAWDDFNKGGDDNDAEFFISFFTTGFKDISIRMDIQANDEVDGGLTRYDFKYDTNPLVDIPFPEMTSTTMIKDFSGAQVTVLNNQTISNPSSFTPFNFDLSGLTAINNQSVVNLRFDDFRGNDGLRIDNIVITGTAVPEPSSAALLGLGALALLTRRKK